MSTNTIVVTVQGSGNGKFYMDGNEGVLALKYGDTYIFDVGEELCEPSAPYFQRNSKNTIIKIAGRGTVFFILFFPPFSSPTPPLFLYFS